MLVLPVMLGHFSRFTFEVLHAWRRLTHWSVALHAQWPQGYNAFGVLEIVGCPSWLLRAKVVLVVNKRRLWWLLS
jgi:hypothetical protein